MHTCTSTCIQLLLGTKLSLFSLLADMSKKRKEKLILGEKFRCLKCLCRKNAFILLLRLEKLTKGSLITFLSNRCHGNRYKSNSFIILILAVRCISSENLNWNGQINWKMCFICVFCDLRGKNSPHPPLRKNTQFSRLCSGFVSGNRLVTIQRTLSFTLIPKKLCPVGGATKMYFWGLGSWTILRKRRTEEKRNDQAIK